MTSSSTRSLATLLAECHPEHHLRRLEQPPAGGSNLALYCQKTLEGFKTPHRSGYALGQNDVTMKAISVSFLPALFRSLIRDSRRFFLVKRITGSSASALWSETDPEPDNRQDESTDCKPEKNLPPRNLATAFFEITEPLDFDWPKRGQTHGGWSRSLRSFPKNGH